MASATLQIPYLDITTVQSAGVSPFFGGVQMNWTAEAQTRTETEPQFKQMELKAWELSGYSVSSNVLLQDSVIGLEKFLMTLFAKAIAWFEEYAFLQGNGVGKPQGMLNARPPCSTRATGADTAFVSFADIAGMWSKLLPASWNKAIWVFSPSVVPQLLQLKDGANAGHLHQHRPGRDQDAQLDAARPAGLPTEKLPALGTKGDLMPDRPAASTSSATACRSRSPPVEHVNFLKNQMTWRVVERVDGQPWLDKPVTLQDGTTQVSPFVVLN